jgi:antitoxin MazE
MISFACNQEPAMKVSKWGGSLAVRLPKELVETEGLVEGEEVEISVRRVEAAPLSDEERQRIFLKAIEKLSFSLPEGYKFDRDEANRRR